MTDYDRIAATIRYLDAHHAEQPDLATLAQQAGLSPHHFHRIFSSWAGITPKDFLQCLTLFHARTRLQEGGSVLETAIDSGLSGAGRLHDLCVTLEAASPGELKAGGRGWTLHAGIAETPFGAALIAESPRGLCHLSFIDDDTKRSAWSDLQRDWPNAEIERDDKAARRLAAQIFKTPAKASHPPLRAFVRGTPFQVRVWRALLRIPAGKVLTYGRLAKALGQSSASRAVGSAVAPNPLGFLIPCHRVIRETGALGGYRWGTVRKRAILAWESSAAHRRGPL